MTDEFERVECTGCGRTYNRRATWVRAGERTCYICQGRSNDTTRGCVYGAHRILVAAGDLPDDLLTPELEQALETVYQGLADKRATYASPTLPERIVEQWRALGGTIAVQQKLPT